MNYTINRNRDASDLRIDPIVDYGAGSRSDYVADTSFQGRMIMAVSQVCGSCQTKNTAYDEGGNKVFFLHTYLSGGYLINFVKNRQRFGFAKIIFN